MTYLDDVAAAVVRAVPAGVAIPDGADSLFLAYAVLVRACGTAVTASDVHDAWVAWMLARDEGHEALVPYESLGEDARGKDEPFVAAIRLVARERSGHRP